MSNSLEKIRVKVFVQIDNSKKKKKLIGISHLILPCIEIVQYVRDEYILDR